MGILLLLLGDFCPINIVYNNRHFFFVCSIKSPLLGRFLGPSLNLMNIINNQSQTQAPLHAYWVFPVLTGIFHVFKSILIPTVPGARILTYSPPSRSCTGSNLVYNYIVCYIFVRFLINILLYCVTKKIKLFKKNN